MESKNWHAPAAFAVVLVLIIAGTFALVGWSQHRSHVIVPAETVEIDGETYGVLDLLTDSGMEQTSSELSRFSSIEELNDIVGQEGNDQAYNYWGGGGGMIAIEDAEVGGLAATSTDYSGDSGDSYTSTNTQVDGVDEGDIVKNDDQYAYIVSADLNSVFIVDAYPAGDAAIVSEIQTEGQARELYISQDYLIIIIQTYYFEGGYQDSAYMMSDEPTVLVKVFDVADRSDPQLLRDYSLEGYFHTSRIIDENLYLIANHYNYEIYEAEEDLPMPIDCLYYIEDENAYYSLTSFMTLDFAAQGNANIMGIYMSSANTVYVSQSNLYITHMKPIDYSDDWSWDDYEENTVIHRIGIQGQGLKYRARGEVPGWILNRYSMDEFDGHFRVATTEGWSWGAGEDQSRNIVTVLDMNMTQTGQLGDIAPGEQIYSARFMGSRCYLVTFRQIDPFFVIDLHDAENPEILGELKIPGYSSYLHPYDENHIIGLGEENSTLKVSLFNVTDVQNPTELDTMKIGSQYSYSNALYDFHAFTFSAEKNLLIIPVYEYSYTSTYDYYDWNYRYYAAVLHISPENGITLEAEIEHPELEQPDTENEWYYYGYYTNDIRRSFIIGDSLFTVSDLHMKATYLEDYSEEALVALE